LATLDDLHANSIKTELKCGAQAHRACAYDDDFGLT